MPGRRKRLQNVFAQLIAEGGAVFSRRRGQNLPGGVVVGPDSNFAGVAPLPADFRGGGLRAGEDRKTMAQNRPILPDGLPHLVEDGKALRVVVAGYDQVDFQGTLLLVGVAGHGAYPPPETR